VAVTAASAPSIRFPFSQLYIKQLIINNGVFNFTDTNAAENGVKITVKDLNINVENINFPIRSSNIINFTLKGKMPWQEGSQEGKIEAEGWLNIFKEQEKAERIAVAVLGKLSEMDQGRYVLTFPIKTKMDRPEFNFELIRTAFEQKITQGRKEGVLNAQAQEVLMLPAKLLEGTFKGATDITKSLIIGTVNVGKEVANAVLGSFKKETTTETKTQENPKSTGNVATEKKE
jgi:hypothetical protein